MKTAEWHQRGYSSDFNIKLKKDTHYYFTFGFEILFPNQVT